MIPQTIHQIWVPPGQDIPAQYLQGIRSWLDMHPNWDYKLWTDEDLHWLTRRDLYNQALELVPSDAVGQFRADIARYEILLRFGGLYVDIDTVCLRPVGEALVGHNEFAAWEDQNWVGNTYLGCTPGHPVMEKLVAGLRDSVRRANGHLRPNRLTGPRYLTPIWLGEGCHVAPQHLFYPYSYSHVKAGTVPNEYHDAYTVHLWGHTRALMNRRYRG